MLAFVHLATGGEGSSSKVARDMQSRPAAQAKRQCAQISYTIMHKGSQTSRKVSSGLQYVGFFFLRSHHVTRTQQPKRTRYPVKSDKNRRRGLTRRATIVSKADYKLLEAERSAYLRPRATTTKGTSHVIGTRVEGSLAPVASRSEKRAN